MGPFVKIDCAALPGELLEAELFGYERGAFTGATSAKPGRLEAAHKGTLVLDEIAHLSRDAQAKLLRVIERREFERLGGRRTVRVDARLVGADERRSGRRRAAARVPRRPLLPPQRRAHTRAAAARAARRTSSRSRRSSSKAYAAKHGRRAATLRAGRRSRRSARTTSPATSASWRNVVERAVIVAEGEALGAGDLPESVRAAVSSPRGAARAAADARRARRRVHTRDARRRARQQVRGRARPRHQPQESLREAGAGRRRGRGRRGDGVTERDEESSVVRGENASHRLQVSPSPFPSGMRLRLIWVGKTRDEHLRALAEEYLKRLSRFARCEVTELREGGRRTTRALVSRRRANASWVLWHRML